MSTIAPLPRTHRRHYVHKLLVRHYQRIIERHLHGTQGLTLVDYGCGDMPYRPMLEPHVAHYLGADLPGNDRAQVTIGNDGRLNLPDASADVVLSSQVLEHVGDPRLYLAECSRVLKPGGRLLLSTHGSWWHHPHPTDYWRWTGDGLRKLLCDSGFAQVEVEGLMGLAATGLYLFQDGAYRRVPRGLRGAFYGAIQVAAAWADRIHTDDDRRRDAAVYVTHSVRIA